MKSQAEKSVIRKKLLDFRSALDAEEVSDHSQQIVARLMKSDLLSASESILFYWPLQGKNEIDLRSILPLLRNTTKELYLPVINRISDRSMIARRIETESDLDLGPFSTQEPRNGKMISPDKLDLVIIPGIAFDRSGTRIGYGGGFYDRYLPKCTDAIFLGVCMRIMLQDLLPREGHDVAVNHILTESEWIECAENATGE